MLKLLQKVLKQLALPVARIHCEIGPDYPEGTPKVASAFYGLMSFMTRRGLLLAYRNHGRCDPSLEADEWSLHPTRWSSLAGVSQGHTVACLTAGKATAPSEGTGDSAHAAMMFVAKRGSTVVGRGDRGRGHTYPVKFLKQGVYQD